VSREELKEIAQTSRSAPDLPGGEVQFRRLLEKLPAGAYTCDPGGLITYYNQHAVHLWGREPKLNHSTDRFCGSFKLFSIDGAPITHNQCWMALALQTNKEYNGHEIIIERPDGRRLTVLAHANPIHDEAGNLLGAVNVLVDISDRKQAEIERTSLLERADEARALAETANRMKDEFIAMISHELRTPLNSMLGWTRLLRAGKLDRPTHERALDIIERNARSQARLLEDLMDLTRIITGKMWLDVQPVNLASVVEAAVESIRPAADFKGIQLDIVFDPNVGPITGDPSRLQQVVWNLLSNGVKFTPGGGRVELRLDQLESYVAISVIDTGVGIPEEFLPFVFDRFRQVDSSHSRNQGGIGLGLAIVRHLVEMHGGTIKAASSGKGKGARFTAILPMNAPKIDPQLVETSIAPYSFDEFANLFETSTSLAGLRVLVVDDQADARELLATVLTGCGADVMTVSSADEALSAIEESKPSVLVSDIEMPERDGHSLIRQVRSIEGEQGARILAVALTAHARAEDRMRALAAGYDMHIPKPVEPAELIAVIASLTKRARENAT